MIEILTSIVLLLLNYKNQGNGNLIYFVDMKSNEL